jgi:hypothetical protein
MFLWVNINLAWWWSTCKFSVHMLLKHNHFHLSEAHYKNKPKTPRPPLYIAEYNSAYSSIAPLSGLFHKLHWEQIIYACMYMHVYVCICMSRLCVVYVSACICHQHVSVKVCIMMCMYLHWPLKRLSPCCYPARPVPLAPVHRPGSSHRWRWVTDKGLPQGRRVSTPWLSPSATPGPHLARPCGTGTATVTPGPGRGPACHSHPDGRARPPVGLHLVSHGVSAARTGFKTSSYGTLNRAVRWLWHARSYWVHAARPGARPGCIDSRAVTVGASRAAVGLSRDRLGRSHWQCHCDSCHLQTTEPTVATKPTVEPSVTRPIPIRLHWPPGSLTWTDSD